MPTIGFRAALATDSDEIARFICAAGGGLYEFLFDDLIPFVTATEVLAAGVASDEPPISYRNCFVATSKDQRVVGVANAFPAVAIESETYPLVPRERLDHIRPILKLYEKDSLLLNALAVHDDVRHRGLGTRLLLWAQSRARSLGLARLSLHVWADNMLARHFYRTHGFIERGVAEVPSHPRLRHSGGSILMSRAVCAEAAAEAKIDEM
ncbi:hypothetical protein XI09_12845 [Bradyrhizobium sp. CCBAU 11386]|nr:hypothetical protein [Bradyrhizobium sp. CCBAU 11386]